MVLLVSACSLQAHGATPADTAEPVFTRATVQSVFDTDGGRNHYVRLKIGPGMGLAFTTLTYRVPERAQIAAFPPGSHVAFQAQRRAGENTLTAIRAAPKVERFDVR